MKKSFVFVLTMGALLFTVSELFQPWFYKDYDSSLHRNAGYHYFKSPPPRASDDEIRKMFGASPNQDFSTAHIVLLFDEGRLRIQRLLLFTLTTGLLLFTVGGASRKVKILGLTVLMLALFLSGILLLRIGMLI